MASGLDDFKRVLKEFRGLSMWTAGGSLAVPFAAALADLSPPWPKGVIIVTAIVELVVLMLVFHFLKSAKRRTINWVLGTSVFVLAGIGPIYLGGMSFFTYQVPTTGERFVKGYVCTPDAITVFAERCPDLGLDELRSAEYEAERLWTRRSVTVNRVVLVVFWSTAFVALSTSLGAFVVYQMRTRGRRS